MNKKYDLFVIGAGSGGVRAARRASAMGARVGLCEEYRMGGTCVIRGCVPKKLLWYGAHYGFGLEDAVDYGWEFEGGQMNWSHLSGQVCDEVSRLEKIYHRLLSQSEVDVYQGHGRLLGQGQVGVCDEVFSSDRILLCPGSRAHIPLGMEGAITSDDVFSLKEFPRRLCLVGGGYIAMELASIFSGLGSDVTLVHRGEILRDFDRDCVNFVVASMKDRGINFIQSAVDGVPQRGHIVFKGGDELFFDQVICATGRVPRTDDLGLSQHGVLCDERGCIDIADDYGTSAKGIYALGDVVAGPQLTPVAIAQAMDFVAQHFGNDQVGGDLKGAIACAVFTHPALASVGLSLAQAQARGYEVSCYQQSFSPLHQSFCSRKERALMKVVVNADNDDILGFHMVGQDSAEIIQSLAVSLSLGVKKSQLDRVVCLHPTLAEEFLTLREISVTSQ